MRERERRERRERKKKQNKIVFNMFMNNSIVCTTDLYRTKIFKHNSFRIIIFLSRIHKIMFILLFSLFNKFYNVFLNVEMY